MNELVQQIATKTGITEEQASGALEMVMDTLRVKLPASVSKQIPVVLKGGEFDYKAVFKERFEFMKDETEDKLTAFADEMNERFEDLGRRAESKFGEVKKDTEGFLRRIFKGREG